MNTSILPPGAVGIGLRAPHYAAIFDDQPALGFLEVHSENFFHAGGAAMRVLERARERYPISLHGVGLSIASGDAFSVAHLDNLAKLVERVEPALVSEHLCWGAMAGVHFNDLLPFAHTHEALALVADRVDQVQSRLGRRILLENLSAYVQFRDSEMSEADFLAGLVARCDCGVLLDVNNLYVNACNLDIDPHAELAKLPGAAIGEIHLAGHTQTEHGLIDTHGSRVAEPVWALYRDAVKRFGPRPTLIEWDTDLPALDVLLDEAASAEQIMRGNV